MKQFLDKEQMLTLKDKGLDVSDASHTWRRFINKYDAIADIYDETGEFICYAYSLGEVVDKLPKFIDNGENFKTYLMVDAVEGKWEVFYQLAKNGLLYTSSEEFIDACFDMLCKLIDGGYITTKK